MTCFESCLQLFSLASNFVTLHGNNHTIEIRFVYVLICILKRVIKDTEGGIFSIELIIDPKSIHFIPKYIFVDKDKVHFFSLYSAL
jgi:hypothetical protein